MSASVRDKLLEQLVSADPIWRHLVGDILGTLEGDTDTARKLVDMLEGRPESFHTRGAILHALGKMNVKEVVPDLLKMLSSGHANGDMIVRAIGRIGGAEAAMGLFKRLGVPIATPPRIAIERELGKLKDVAVLRRIEEGLAEADANTQVSYLYILRATRDSRYSKAVCERLKIERDPDVRKAAIRALGFFDDPDSGKVLMELALHGTEQDRKYAIRAIYHRRDAKMTAAVLGRR